MTSLGILNSLRPVYSLIPGHHSIAFLVNLPSTPEIPNNLRWALTTTFPQKGTSSTHNQKIPCTPPGLFLIFISNPPPGLYQLKFHTGYHYIYISNYPLQGSPSGDTFKAPSILL